MLDPDKAKGTKDENQNKLCPGDGLFHGVCTDMDEFSELIAKVPKKVLFYDLMTYQQRLSATALWEACNYGGRPKPGDLRYMEDKRAYAEWVLKIDHQKQWETAKKRGKL